MTITMSTTFLLVVSYVIRGIKIRSSYEYDQKYNTFNGERGQRRACDRCLTPGSEDARSGKFQCRAELNRQLTLTSVSQG
jgi:hypothetical protein